MSKNLPSIEALIAEILEEEEFQDCFLIEIKQSETRLEVFLDADKGVDFTKCRKISRKVEAFLDESLVLGEKYTLEVSSPGAKEPLRLLRQYPKHIGRKIKIILNDQTELEGVFTSLENETIKMDVMDGKKVKEKRNINFNDISKSFILLAF